MYSSKPPYDDSCVACRISATSSSSRFEYRQETEVEGEEATAAAAGQSAGGQQQASAAAGVEDIRARLERIKQSVAF